MPNPISSECRAQDTAGKSDEDTEEVERRHRAVSNLANQQHRLQQHQQQQQQEEQNHYHHLHHHPLHNLHHHHHQQHHQHHSYHHQPPHQEGGHLHHHHNHHHHNSPELAQPEGMHNNNGLHGPSVHGGGVVGSDPDLFSFLSAMHLSTDQQQQLQHQIQQSISSASASGNSAALMAATLVDNLGPSITHIMASRKRKILDHGSGNQGGSGPGKLNGFRPPALRGNSDEEADRPLHTPQCSQSGYGDDEDRGDQYEGNSKEAGIDDHLAADFDGSFSGLGVDITSSNFSMSEALLALPNLTISTGGNMFKQENNASCRSPKNSGSAADNPIARDSAANSVRTEICFKEEPLSLTHSPDLTDNGGSVSVRQQPSTSKSVGGKKSSTPGSRGSTTLRKHNLNGGAVATKILEALDLSSDEAHFPESLHSTAYGASGQEKHSKTSFTGSVSRDSSNEAFSPIYAVGGSIAKKASSSSAEDELGTSFLHTLSGSQPNLPTLTGVIPLASLTGASNHQSVSDGAKNVGAASLHHNTKITKGQMMAGTTTAASTTHVSNKSHKIILPLHSQSQSMVFGCTAGGIRTSVGPTPSKSGGSTSGGTTSSSSNNGNGSSHHPCTTIYGAAQRLMLDSGVNPMLPSLSLLEGIGVGGAAQAGCQFQYILAASTSNATKINEPSITYLNQGQAYELKVKKLGDLSSLAGSMSRFLVSRVRICFHERRLQYMEADQLKEWNLTHPGQRVLDLDIPLSYGALNPLLQSPQETGDPTHTSVLSFKWDPMRDTGIFIKVNCISTEFTPKKHGGEKGVPFRLQVETFSEEVLDSSGSINNNNFHPNFRMHAGGCILQVFKLKGADRKHKQDRDKIGKRPLSEREKFSPSYDCTVLTDMAPDNVYTPVSAVMSTTPQGVVKAVAAATVTTVAGSSSSSLSTIIASSSGAGALFGGMDTPCGSTTPTSGIERGWTSPLPHHHAQQQAMDTKTPSGIFTSSGVKYPVHEKYLGLTESRMATGTLTFPGLHEFPLVAVGWTADDVSQWLIKNNFEAHQPELKNFSGIDILRLTREELISICGLAEGLRLYNSLHMTVLAPACTLFIAPKDSNEFAAIYLEKATVADLLKKLANSVGVPSTMFVNAFMVGPQGILVRVTDSVVSFWKPESVFRFSLRSSSSTCIGSTSHPLSGVLHDINSELTTLSGSNTNLNDLAQCDVIIEKVSMPHRQQQHHHLHSDQADSIAVRDSSSINIGEDGGKSPPSSSASSSSCDEGGKNANRQEELLNGLATSFQTVASNDSIASSYREDVRIHGGIKDDRDGGSADMAS